MEILSHNEYRELLQDSSLFAMFDREELFKLFNVMQVIKYQQGEHIYKENQLPMGMVYLQDGKVKIFKKGIGGREQIVRLVNSAGLVGYRSMIASENHISSAVAIENSVVCVIPRDYVLNCLVKNHSFAVMVLQELAKELGDANARTLSLTQKHIRGRLAESLLLLKEKYGFEEDNCTIKVYLSREDIANLSNMTTSNAIRTLSSFAAEGVIEMDGRVIRVIDIDSLRKISILG